MSAQLLPRLIGERQDMRAAHRNYENLLIASAFLLTLAFFLIGSLNNFSIKCGTPVGLEKRAASAFPHVGFSRPFLVQFPAGFEAFFNDRFALRTHLVYSLALLRFKYFGLTDRDRVLVGSDGWLFYRDGGDEETLRRLWMSEPELAAWAKMLTERRNWCLRHGIKFFYVITPSKSSIYREFVPPQYTMVYPYSQADQLIYYLHAHTKVDVIDLRPILQAQKDRGLLFFKTDTHWNKLGAYIGYRAVADRLKKQFPAIRPVELSDMQVIRNVERNGDLLEFISLPGVLEDRYDDFQPRNGQGWRMSKNPPPPENIFEELTRFVPFATENDEAAPVKAFFIRDSFWIWAQPYFSETFRRAYFSWDGVFGFPAAQIAKEKPDFVVMEMVERFLARPVPLNPPDVK